MMPCVTITKQRLSNTQCFLTVPPAPCQPTHLAAQVECGSNQAHLSWQHVGSAMSYTAEVTGEHGHVASCSSSNSSCAVKLHCGRSYSASVVAITDSCNSTQSSLIQFDSGMRTLLGQKGQNGSSGQTAESTSMFIITFSTF